MKKLSLAVLAAATLLMVGCKKENTTDYLKNLNGYWLYENAEATPAKVALEVADNAVVLTVDKETAKGTVAYDASKGEGTITCDGQPANATITAKSISGDKKSLQLIVTEDGKTVFDAKMTKTVKPEEPGEGSIPDLDKPADGMVRFAIHIPAGSECNGIAFKGTFDGSAWSGENTYCNAEQNAQVGPDECVKFQPIDGSDEWYTADFKLGATPWGDNSDIYMAGKICLIYTGDGSWQGQAIDWDYNEAYTTAAVSKSGDGNIQVNGTGLVYVEIGGWQKSECVTVELKDYTINLKAPECGNYEPAIIGSFEASNWNEAFPLTKQADGSYQIVVKAAEDDTFKFKAVGDTDWSNQIQILVKNEETGAEEWADNPDMKFGAETTINVDYSAGKYTLCE